jgi:Domain of unknown function (DUF1996)
VWGKADGDPYDHDEEPRETRPTPLRARVGASFIILALLAGTARGGWLIVTRGPRPSNPPNGLPGGSVEPQVAPEVKVSESRVLNTAVLPSVPFMVRCQISHEVNDDPLLLPNQPGKSHLHSFFGNTTTKSSSTVASLLGEATSCDDPSDTASYWMPSPVGARWTAVRAYYSAGDLPPSSVKVYPPGFAMIGGTPPKTLPTPTGGHAGHPAHGTSAVEGSNDLGSMANHHEKRSGAELGQRATWSCGRAIDEQGWDVVMPTCPNGVALAARIIFGQCALKESSGLAEVVFAHSGTCPSSHPFGVAQLRIRAELDGRPTAFSSGPLETLHADFLNAWNQPALEELHNVCINGNRTTNEIKRCGLRGTGPRVTGFG